MFALVLVLVPVLALVPVIVLVLKPLLMLVLTLDTAALVCLCKLCPLKPVKLSVSDLTRCITLMNTETENQKLLVKVAQKLFRLAV